MQTPGQNGYAGSAIMGVVFSAGWTPCIGPVYGAVLTMAANGGDVAQAGGLLTAYSLGLGIPFLLTALMLDSAQGVLHSLRRHMHKIELASGAFLVLIGLLIASGTLQQLSTRFSGEFADFSITVEESVLELFGGGAEESAASSEVESAPVDEPEARSANPDDTVLVDPQTNQTAPAEAAGISSITDLAAASDATVGLQVGDIAPGFESITDTGQPIRLADTRGDIVLLNFWATWCGPCRIEMPVFERIYNQHRDDGFTIVAVNNGETPADVQAFRDEFDERLTFPVAMDETATIQQRYNIFSYPSTFLLDRDGTILARHFGPLTDDQIEAMVDDALSQ
jgi:cytochrome c-type biogenesis protein